MTPSCFEAFTRGAVMRRLLPPVSARCSRGTAGNPSPRENCREAGLCAQRIEPWIGAQIDGPGGMLVHGVVQSLQSASDVVQREPNQRAVVRRDIGVPGPLQQLPLDLAHLVLSSQRGQ